MAKSLSGSFLKQLEKEIMKNLTGSRKSMTPARPSSFLWFICIAYLTQGIAQHFCLIAQPLDYYMLKALGSNAAEVASLLSVLMIPWMIKPVYGIVSDFLPLAGYRRKSYLILAYSLGGCFYLVSALASSFSALIFALFLTATGMAIGTTIICGLTLEVGRPGAQTRTFQSIQAVCYYSASIISFLIGGALCANLVPSVALHCAAAIAAVPCFVTAGSAWWLLRENKSTRTKIDLVALKNVFYQLRARKLLVVALFLCCWSFSPGFGTPLYFHETKTLGFTQLFIGQLGAINSVGMIVGALIFSKCMDRKLGTKTQATISVLIGTVSTFGYLLLASESSAILLEFFRGVANVIAVLTIYGLAADVSPKRMESTSIALLIAAYNIAEQISNVLGANLYSYVFKDGFAELIVVSALATLACMLLVPVLPDKDQYAS